VVRKVLSGGALGQCNLHPGRCVTRPCRLDRRGSGFDLGLAGLCRGAFKLAACQIERIEAKAQHTENSQGHGNGGNGSQ